MNINFAFWDSSIVNRFFNTLLVYAGIIVGFILFIFLLRLIIAIILFRFNQTSNRKSDGINHKCTPHDSKRRVKKSFQYYYQIYRRYYPCPKEAPETFQTKSIKNHICNQTQNKKDNSSNNHVQILP